MKDYKINTGAMCRKSLLSLLLVEFISDRVKLEDLWFSRYVKRDALVKMSYLYHLRQLLNIELNKIDIHTSFCILAICLRTQKNIRI